MLIHGVDATVNGILKQARLTKVEIIKLEWAMVASVLILAILVT